MTPVEMARWPAALEPWLDPATRLRALPPPWSPACAGSQTAEAGLKIVGITTGETLRRSSTGHAPRLRLEARGGQETLYWLVDGRQIGRSEAGKSLVHDFTVPGRHSITVLDDGGRFDSVEISVQ